MTAHQICPDVVCFSDMLNGGGSLAKYLNDEDSDDGEQDQDGEEDLKNDPIYILDLQVSTHLRLLLSNAR